MNYKTAIIISVCAFSLAFVIACGAQSDSLSADEILIQKLIDDPMTEQIRTLHQTQKDLIMYNNLDLEALGKIIENAPDQDVCKVTEDVSGIAHGADYLKNMCRHIKLVAAIKEKHPVVLNLDSDARVKIFYSSEPITFDEAMDMIISKDKID